MSDGLLKERILEHFTNWTMGKTALDYRRKEITKILNEAKIDAPKTALQKLDPLAWITWFEKWFGEAKKQ